MGLSPSLETAIVGCLIACLGAFALYSARRRAREATKTRARAAQPASNELSGVVAGSIFIVIGCALVAKSALDLASGSH